MVDGGILHMIHMGGEAMTAPYLHSCGNSFSSLVAICVVGAWSSVEQQRNDWREQLECEAAPAAHGDQIAGEHVPPEAMARIAD